MDPNGAQASGIAEFREVLAQCNTRVQNLQKLSPYTSALQSHLNILKHICLSHATLDCLGCSISLVPTMKCPLCFLILLTPDCPSNSQAHTMGYSKMSGGLVLAHAGSLICNPSFKQGSIYLVFYVNIYIYIYTHVIVHIYIHVYCCRCLSMHIYTFLWIGLYLYVYIYICVYIYIYMYADEAFCVCVCVCVRI